jgi:hypothetical protein
LTGLSMNGNSSNHFIPPPFVLSRRADTFRLVPRLSPLCLPTAPKYNSGHFSLLLNSPRVS